MTHFRSHWGCVRLSYHREFFCKWGRLDPKCAATWLSFQSHPWSHLYCHLFEESLSQLTAFQTALPWLSLWKLQTSSERQSSFSQKLVLEPILGSEQASFLICLPLSVLWRFEKASAFLRISWLGALSRTCLCSCWCYLQWTESALTYVGLLEYSLASRYSD